MTDNSRRPVDGDNVEDLTHRAEELIDRRAMLASTGRKLALPVLVTYVCSREAMGMTGSGGLGVTGDSRTVTPTTGGRSRFIQRARRQG